MGKMGRDWTGCYRPGRGVGDVRSGLPAGTRAAFARRDREGVDRDRRRRRERARRSRATTHLVTPHAPDDAPTASASAGAGSALRARLASYTPNAHHASIDATCATMTPSGNAPVSDAVTTSASSGISSIATRSGGGGVGGVGREGRGTRSALDGSTRAFRHRLAARGSAKKRRRGVLYSDRWRFRKRATALHRVAASQRASLPFPSTRPRASRGPASSSPPSPSPPRRLVRSERVVRSQRRPPSARARSPRPRASRIARLGTADASPRRCRPRRSASRPPRPRPRRRRPLPPRSSSSA